MKRDDRVLHGARGDATLVDIAELRAQLLALEEIRAYRREALLQDLPPGCDEERWARNDLDGEGSEGPGSRPTMRGLPMQLS